MSYYTTAGSSKCQVAVRGHNKNPQMFDEYKYQSRRFSSQGGKGSLLISFVTATDISTS